MKQALNPFLPSYEYVPDAEPYVFGDRVYIYGSHDKFDGMIFCLNDYVCWSAPVDDLSDWKYEGVIYKKTQDSLAKKNMFMCAPDITLAADGKYYLYYSLSGVSATSIAVSKTPTGPFEFYDYVRNTDGSVLGSDKENDVFQFDPAVFVDDDNKIYLYNGFAPQLNKGLQRIQNNFNKICDGAYVYELEQDMKTVKAPPKCIAKGAMAYKGLEYKGHEFFEASSMRKIKGTYYFIYSSVNSHELCYMTSKKPDEDFKYGGTIISNGDLFLNGHSIANMAYNYVGNVHGSIVKINNEWYVFYHRHTNKNMFSRQAMAEKITIENDGSIKQVETTSCGLNPKALKGEGEYEARIACNLMSSTGAGKYGFMKRDFKNHPYFTQDGKDREDNPNQYIANISNGCRIGYKYFEINGLNEIELTVKGKAEGIMYVKDGLLGNYVGKIEIKSTAKKSKFSGKIQIDNGIKALFFEFAGNGTFDFHSFLLKCNQ